MAVWSEIKYVLSCHNYIYNMYMTNHALTDDKRCWLYAYVALCPYMWLCAVNAVFASNTWLSTNSGLAL